MQFKLEEWNYLKKKEISYLVKNYNLSYNEYGDKIWKF